MARKGESQSEKAARLRTESNVVKLPKGRSRPPKEDNHVLTEEEIEALQHYYTQKVKTGRSEIELAQAVVATKRQGVNDTFALIKAELHINRKQFEEMLEKEKLGDDEFLAEEKARALRFKRQGFPSAQGDLFNKGDSADDEGRAYNAGVRAGLSAAEPKLPEHISPVFHDRFMQGYNDGQAENIMKLQTAEAVIQRKKDGAKITPEASATLDEVAAEDVV